MLRELHKHNTFIAAYKTKHLDLTATGATRSAALRNLLKRMQAYTISLQAGQATVLDKLLSIKR